MSYAACMRGAITERGVVAIPGCLAHCTGTAWRAFVDLVMQLG